MSKGQDKLLDALMKEPMDVNRLIDATCLSASFVRNSLKYLESTGQVEKVDSRVPYIYRIPPNNPLIRYYHLIEDYKKDLIYKPKADSFTEFMNTIPKEQWIEIIPNLEALAIAITTLHEEGKLTSTLEGAI